MSEKDYIQRPVDEGYQRGIESMGRGRSTSAGEWLEAVARMMAMGLALRGGVGMPGGIARRGDIQANLPLQVRQGRASATMRNPKQGLQPYTTEGAQAYLRQPAQEAVQGPLPTTYHPGGGPGPAYPWTPAHEREGLWEQMLDYLIGTSRQ